MSKTIQIEYCSNDGFSASGVRLKKSLATAFPGVEIEAKPAD